MAAHAATGTQTASSQAASSSAFALSPLATIAVASLYVALYTSNAILMKLSRDPISGKYEYNPVAVTLMNESLKLAVSCVMIPPEAIADTGEALAWNNVWPYAVPGLVYLVDDNLQYGIYYYLKPSEATLWANVRVLTTAVVFRLLIGRELKYLQWISLLVLTVGLVLAHDSGGSHAHGDALTALTPTPPPPPPARVVAAQENESVAGFLGLNVGHMLVLLVAVVGSFGNVFGERLLKRELEQSLHLQNAKLYFWGVVLNLVAFLWYGWASESVNVGSVLHGWNLWTFCLVFVQAAIGLTISVIFKFLDNIFKVQVSSLGFLATVLSTAFLFGAKPTRHFYVGAALVLGSVYAYNLSKSQKPSPSQSTSQKGTQQLSMEQHC
ncbi:UDP-galactose transporter [Pseudoscourfieldia marina]